MKKIKTLVLNSLVELFLTKKMAIFASLLLTVTIAPIAKQQMITGPIVNAALFASVILLGFRGAFLIAFLPSLFAIQFGLLPIVMTPLIPFIIASNFILVFIFSYLRKTNYWLGIVSASFIKFIFLFTSSSVIVSLFIKGPAAKNIAQMMSWPQLITALSGGLVVYLFLKIYDSKKQKNF